MRAALLLSALSGCTGCPPDAPSDPPGPRPSGSALVDADADALPPELDCAQQSSPNCMLRVPGGTFRMGAQAADPDAPGYDPDAAPHEGPVHEVTLTPFWISSHEVTVAMYRRCLGEDMCRPDEIARTAGATIDVDGQTDLPMNLVSWAGADRLCRWLGGRLPTEAEWEYAARGADGRRYPWGDDPGCGTGIEDPTAPWSKIMAPPPCRHDGPSHPSDLRGDSPFGLKGMAANVWEWVADRYAADAYAHHDAVDPAGPTTGELRVQRGGGWTDADPVDLRSATRAAMPEETMLADVGFRCVWRPPSGR